MRTLITRCFVLLSCTLCASAQLVVPVSQNRTVAGEVSVDDIVNYFTDSEQFDAPDYGPFDEAASGYVDVGDAFGSAGGWQESELTGSTVRARGSAFANSESYDFIWLSESNGWSELAYEFTLTAPSDYVAQGVVAAFDNGIATFFIRDLNATYVTGETAFGPAETIDIDETGTLPAGDYELVVRATGSCLASGFDLDYAFAEFELDFQLTPQATTYCPGVPNSTGLAGAISASGSTDLGLNDFQLHADQLPQNKFGYFLVSASQTSTQPPNSQGNLCLGSPLGRFNAQVRNSGEQGWFWIPVDLTNLPAFGSVMSGETWNFQCWYRDNNPGSTSNFTNALEVFFP